MRARGPARPPRRVGRHGGRGVRFALGGRAVARGWACGHARQRGVERRPVMGWSSGELQSEKTAPVWPGAPQSGRLTPARPRPGVARRPAPSSSQLTPRGPVRSPAARQSGSGAAGGGAAGAAGAGAAGEASAGAAAATAAGGTNVTGGAARRGRRRDGGGRGRGRHCGGGRREHVGEGLGRQGGPLGRGGRPAGSGRRGRGGGRSRRRGLRGGGAGRAAGAVDCGRWPSADPCAPAHSAG